jgi:hypothetical protein
MTEAEIEKLDKIRAYLAWLPELNIAKMWRSVLASDRRLGIFKYSANGQ